MCRMYAPPYGGVRAYLCVKGVEAVMVSSVQRRVVVVCAVSASRQPRWKVKEEEGVPKKEDGAY